MTWFVFNENPQVLCLRMRYWLDGKKETQKKFQERIESDIFKTPRDKVERGCLSEEYI